MGIMRILPSRFNILLDEVCRSKTRWSLHFATYSQKRGSSLSFCSVFRVFCVFGAEVLWQSVLPFQAESCFEPHQSLRLPCLTYSCV